MSAGNPNVSASVRARLLNVAKTQGVDFQPLGCGLIRPIPSSRKNSMPLHGWA